MARGGWLPSRLLIGLVPLLVAALVVGLFRYHLGHWPWQSADTVRLARSWADGLGARQVRLHQLFKLGPTELEMQLGPPEVSDQQPGVYFGFYQWQVGALKVEVLIAPAGRRPELIILQPVDQRADLDTVLSLAGVEDFDEHLEVETDLFYRFRPIRVDGHKVESVTWWFQPGGRSLVVRLE